MFRIRNRRNPLLRVEQHLDKIIRDISPSEAATNLDSEVTPNDKAALLKSNFIMRFLDD